MTREEAIERIRRRINGMSWCIDDEDKDALATLIPELTESEDERIRKALIDGVRQIRCKNGITQEQMIAYLEKQKEQKSEEKPINWTELTWKDIVELEGIINNVHYEFRNGIGQESFGKEVLEKFREYKGDEYLDGIEQQVRGSISRLMVKGKGVYKICPHCKSRMIRDDSKVYTSEPPQYGYNCPKCGTIEYDTIMYDSPEMEEQPVERNEDERIIEWLIGIVNGCKELSFEDKVKLTRYLEKQKEQKSTEYPICKATEDKSHINWSYLEECPKEDEYEVVEKGDATGLRKKSTESNPDTANFDEGFKTGHEVGFREGAESVKPAEWSEEDKRALNNAIVALSMYANGEIPYLLPSQLLEDVERLKSLYPQPNRNLVVSFMDYLDEHRPEGKMCLSNGECADIETAFKENDWAKIIRYVNKYHQPHWKPSKEQMEQLNSAADLHEFGPMVTTRKQFPDLKSLYNELLKNYKL